MSFEVNWGPEAYSQLAATWLTKTANRGDITAAQARADQWLAADPLYKGTLLSEGLYAINVPPLRVLYEIDVADRIVMVVSVSWLP